MRQRNAFPNLERHVKVEVIENVLKLNDEIASLNRATLQAHGIHSLDLIGAPGCGKTALLEYTLKALQGQLRCAVIVGDMATQRDADRLAPWTEQVVQVNTGQGCHLDANQVRQAIQRLDLAAIDLLVIENVGNLICPVGFDLGQDVKVGMFSIAEGDDKPAKHPYLVQEVALLLLNKVDLRPYVPFDQERFGHDVRRLNATVRVLELSALRGTGMENWLEWLRKLAACKGPAT